MFSLSATHIIAGLFWEYKVNASRVKFKIPEALQTAEWFTLLLTRLIPRGMPLHTSHILLLRSSIYTNICDRFHLHSVSSFPFVMRFLCLTSRVILRHRFSTHGRKNSPSSETPFFFPARSLKPRCPSASPAVVEIVYRTIYSIGRETVYRASLSCGTVYLGNNRLQPPLIRQRELGHHSRARAPRGRAVLR